MLLETDLMASVGSWSSDSFRPTRTMPFAPAWAQALAISFRSSQYWKAERSVFGSLLAPPRPPVAPVIKIVFPVAFSSGFLGSMAG